MIAIDATDPAYGMSSSNTAAQNMAALKAAVAATPVRGKCIVPSDGGVYQIDTSGGLSNAIVIDKRMVLQIDGDIQTNYGTMQTNPPYIGKVTAERVIVTGEGSIIGSGSIDDTDAGDETTFPGFFYVTADKFKCTIDTIDTPPKLAILLYGCKDAQISVRNWQGGVVNYTVGNTAYFGVRATGGGRHRITNNNFNRDDNGGRLITAYFSGGLLGGSDNCTVSNNHADCHEKLTYAYGNYTHIFGNEVQDMLQTDSMRVIGSYNKLHDNRGDNVKGGITMYDGVYNEAVDNKFTKVQQIAVYAGQFYSSYTGGFSGTKIRGNEAWADGTSNQVSDGVYTAFNGADSADVDVSWNSMYGFAKNVGEGSVRVTAMSPYALTDSNISNNKCGDSSQNGVVISRVTGSEIAHNRGRNIAAYLLVENDGANNRFLDNKGRSVTSIGISGLSPTSRGEGNQYTDAPLSDVITLNASRATTITHGGVAPNAIIYLQEVNADAGDLATAKGRCYTALNGTNFDIAVPNGLAASGTEQFAYRILQ